MVEREYEKLDENKDFESVYVNLVKNLDQKVKNRKNIKNVEGLFRGEYRELMMGIWGNFKGWIRRRVGES